MKLNLEPKFQKVRPGIDGVLIFGGIGLLNLNVIAGTVFVTLGSIDTAFYLQRRADSKNRRSRIKPPKSS